MRILVIKLSSLGDIVHTFPAIQDLFLYLGQKSDISSIDWLVDESFQDLVAAQTCIRQIHALPLRKLKSNFSWSFILNILKLLKYLGSQDYDVIIDAQGLFKSAILGFLIQKFSKFKKPQMHGLDALSAREKIASFFYNQTYLISKNNHAIHRTRMLFSNIFNYAIDLKINHYGLNHYEKTTPKSLFFLHGSSWNNKAWVDDYWIQLAQMLFKKEPELKIFLTFGSKLEQDRVLYFKKICPQFEIIDSAGQGLAELLPVLARAWGIVSVDSGLGHLGLALNTPVIGIYGPTSPLKTGFWGEKTALCQSSLPCVPCLKKVCKIDPRAKHPPCMQALPPNLVFDHILKLIG